MELTWHAATAANLLEAKKKHSRLGSRKSRLGCVTCKTRRVKCDEAKPECNRCTSTGRKCQGYSDSISKVANGNSLIGSQLSQSLGLQEAERRTFDFFLSWAAPRLAGTLDKDFWCGHVLQIAHFEPLVLDTLLAISTLYEHPQYMKSFHDKQPDPVLPGHADVESLRSQSRQLDVNHINALKLYNRAIGSFKERLQDGKATPLLALLSCLLFICVEVIRDNIFAALSLFTRGTELLKQSERLIMEDKDQGLLTTIQLMFVRLGVLAASFGHSSVSNAPHEPAISKEHPVFGDMTDARTALFDFMADSNAYIRDTNAWKRSLILDHRQNHAPAEQDNSEYLRISVFDATSSIKSELGLKPVQNVISQTGEAISTSIKDSLDVEEAAELLDNDNTMDVLDEKLPQYQISTLLNESPAMYDLSDLSGREMALKERLDQWLEAFESIMNREDQKDPETASYLLMYYYSTLIWLLSRLDSAQTVFDSFTHHFQEIIRHAEVYIKAKATQKPAFTFEVGAVPPLYFTATKCRIPSLRRRALDLMSEAPGKECHWGANGTAEVASRLITIEEDGLGLPLPDCSGQCSDYMIDDTTMPSEERRVHNIEILRNWSTHSFDLRVTRYSSINGRLLPFVDDFPI